VWSRDLLHVLAGNVVPYVMLLQGGFWPPALALMVHYYGCNIEWLYPVDDGGAAVLDIAARGPIGAAYMTTRPGDHGGTCARVEAIARIVPGKGSCISQGIVSKRYIADASLRASACQCVYLSPRRLSGSPGQRQMRSETVTSAVPRASGIR
jgi:hypothetical protein